MDKTDYLDRFDRALKGLSGQERQDILREIRANLEDFAGSDAALVDRFGRPEELAASYLEGRVLKPSLARRGARFGKKLIYGVSASVGLVVMVVAVAGWYFTRDHFDVHDGAEARAYFSDQPMHQLAPEAGPLQLFADQSRVLIYPAHGSADGYQCKGNARLDGDGVLQLRQAFCAVYQSAGDLAIQA
ncbi:MAG: hypothetical protein AAF418_07215, partial [Pseudomonadota bacterium]